MKRLLVRMTALATVVALGLIAIAQAQRGVRETPPDETSASAAETQADDGQHAPRPFPGAERANPLRPPTESSPADGAVLASGVTPRGSLPAREAGDASRVPTETDQSDPFAALAGNRIVVDVPARPAGEGPASPPASIPQADPPEAAGEAARPYPALLGPADADAAELTPPATPYPDGSQNSTAPARQYDSIPDAREPAPFNPDPRLPASTIPDAAGGSGSLERMPSGEGPQLGVPGAMSGAGASGSEGSGRPGSSQLEGAQAPQLAIQKFAPAEVQVGKPATFKIQVQNTGRTAAQDVEIHDEIPEGMQLLSTNPRASRGVRGELVWSLGTMNPGEEKTVEAEFTPVEEGELGSVATVLFSAEASVRTTATKPELVVRTSAPSEVLIGEELLLQISVSNPGSGVATGVVLEERIPSGLAHPAGAELEYEVGDLKPGETRQLELRLTAERPGPTANVLVARADANLKTEDRLDLEVLAPGLDVAIDGPSRRYLEREATYTLSVANPGTAPAKNVELVAYLPHGMQFVSANNAGAYEESSRTVRWRLEELPVRETGSVQLVAMPVDAGQHAIKLVGSTPDGLSAEKEQEVSVEGIAAILFEVVDVDDPIETGGETTYEIRVLNQGSKAATNVRVAAVLPPQMRPVAAEGPVRHTIEGNRVLFEGLSRLAPKADTTYRVRVQGLEPGDLRVNVQIVTDELKTPVTKEESTRVYADE